MTSLADKTKINPPLASLEPLIAMTRPAMVVTNQIIIERMESEIDLIPTLAGHLVSAGGKRLRPMLTLAGAFAAGADEKNLARASKLAAAIEFIHTATLLHDDVVDASEMRRGDKTASVIWGNEASVLVGDFLFARAFELMVEVGNIEVLGCLARASSKIAEGEIAQMALTGNLDAGYDSYLAVITAKTAELFAAAAKGGTMVSGGDEANRALMADYGKNLGIAFQIADDALDYSASGENLGKTIGDDFREGKITLPVLLAWQDGNEVERDFWQRCLGQGEIGQGDLEQAMRILSRHNAIARTLAEAQKYAVAAHERACEVTNIEAGAALMAAAWFAADRMH